MMRSRRTSPSPWRGGSLTIMLSLLFLALSSVVSAGKDKTQADYFVSSLPGQPDGPLLKMHAGHIEITPKHNGNLFFWHYANRHIAGKQRTVIWINGGPGCSSMDGAMMEIGPYRVRPEGQLEYNNGSWDQWANLLFVDNPVGTGFSYVDTDSYVHELDEMASQFVTFLEEFFKLFPEYDQDDIYIAGESYAGQHIPYIAKHILKRNQGKVKPWNLEGLLIGNGWISPMDQYLSYRPFAYESGILEEGSTGDDQVQAAEKICQQKLKSGGANYVDTSECENILTTILRVTRDDTKDKSCVNMYDVRLRDVAPSCGMNWPPDLTDVTPYLRRDDVKQAIHINPDKKTGWTECNGAVSSNFGARDSDPSVSLLPSLLEEVPIVLFSGNKDLICNHLGTESLISHMTWNGAKGWNSSKGKGKSTPKRNWVVDGEPAGYYQEARNLTYVLFYDSSHMVPFDYSARSRDMLNRFMGLDVESLLEEQVDSEIDGVEDNLGGHHKEHSDTDSPKNGSPENGDTKSGNAKNGTVPVSEEVDEKIDEKVSSATKHAYYRSGEVALVVIIIVVGIWGFLVWRDRRRRRGYKGIKMDEDNFGGRGRRLDEEAAEFEVGDNEMDELASSDNDEPQKTNGRAGRRYSIGGASDDSQTALGKA